MTINIGGKTYYSTLEICEKAEISRSTLLRWIKTGILQKNHRDRRGWRIFTETDLKTIIARASRIDVEYSLIQTIKETEEKSEVVK